MPVAGARPWLLADPPCAVAIGSAEARDPVAALRAPGKVARASAPCLVVVLHFDGTGSSLAITQCAIARLDPAFADPAFADPAFADPAFADPAFADPAFADPAFALTPLSLRHTRTGQVRPNPSLERTSTGLARKAREVHHPPRGPIRFRPAQLKRSSGVRSCNPAPPD
ncbi:hypothetical protein CKO22_14805 [Thiococcus pfennigii]|nr:hypothetical protein [Thiococcus pfennigii]